MPTLHYKVKQVEVRPYLRSVEVPDGLSYEGLLDAANEAEEELSYTALGEDDSEGRVLSDTIEIQEVRK